MQEMNEFEKLEAAVDAFSSKMKTKLREKAEQGLTGWDSRGPANRELLFEKFISHVESQYNGFDEWVDLANFCMFLERIDNVEGRHEISA